jgi:hypothetical protein
VPAADLPATLIIYCPNFGNPRQFTYLVDVLDGNLSATINVTIQSNAMMINHTAENDTPQQFQFALPLLISESMIALIVLISLSKITMFPVRISSRNLLQIPLIIVAFLLPLIASLTIPTTFGFFLWFSAPVMGWLTVLNANLIGGRSNSKTISLIVAVLITLVWLAFTWNYLILQSPTVVVFA